MMESGRAFYCGILLCLLCLGVGVKPPPAPPPFPAGFQLLDSGQFPAFLDDADAESLRTAAERSLAYFQKIPKDKILPFGNGRVFAGDVEATLRLFLDLLRTGRLDRASIAEHFDVYLATPGSDIPQPLATGYYEPVLDGSLRRSERFSYPIYGIPSAPPRAPVAFSDPAGSGSGSERLAGKPREKQSAPCYTRAEIDGPGKPISPENALVWIENPVEGFFLHVQGSGMIRLPGGEFIRIGYAASNGRPYVGIGKILIERGIIPREAMSLKTLKTWLNGHPAERDEILNLNPSYVFFRRVEQGPVGSIGVVLVPGRSVATDLKIHPPGAPAFLEAEIPSTSSVTGRAPLSRWVLNQDTGGAIKGPGRVDLFCGSGKAAEETAGGMKYPSRIYFLMKKGNPAR